MANALHIKVKTLQPATYDIVSTDEATVLDLKEKLVQHSGIPVDRQRLIFRGQVMHDSASLTGHGVENGHVLHLVERPEGIPNGGVDVPDDGRRTAADNRFNVGVIDVSGAVAAAGGMTGFLQSLSGRPGNQMQVVTHPPVGSQQGESQVIQMMAVAGDIPLTPVPHQLTALNNYLLRLANTTSTTTLPPFSMVARLGQQGAEQAAFLETARAALNGADLSESVQDFVQSVRPEQPPPQGQAGQTGAEQARGHQFGPQPISLSNDMLRLGTLAVSQVARQALIFLQTQTLPSFASAVTVLRQEAEQGGQTLETHAAQIMEQARTISNTAYNAGSLLLEISLAAANLAQAGNGNAGPLLSAQTGFLAPDGSQPQMTNRIPTPAPFLGTTDPQRGQELGRVAGFNGAQQGNRSEAVPLRSEATSASQPNRTQRGADIASPLAHAFFNAITDDETRTRHMRLPVRLPDGTSIRLDLSSVVNTLEAFILSTPQEVITRVLTSVLQQGADEAQRSLGTLMSQHQTEEQRRQIYLNLVQPILQAAFHSLDCYFQQVYRVIPHRSSTEDQPAIRPTRRGANRPVPSLTQPFATIPNPARDVMSTTGVAAGRGMSFGTPGGEMHVEMSIENTLEVPANLANISSSSHEGSQRAPSTAHVPPSQEAAASQSNSESRQSVPIPGASSGHTVANGQQAVGNSFGSSQTSTQLFDDTDSKGQGASVGRSKVTQPGEGAPAGSHGEKGKEIAGVQGGRDTNRNSRSLSRGAGLNMPRLPERRRSTPTSATSLQGSSLQGLPPAELSRMSGRNMQTARVPSNNREGNSPPASLPSTGVDPISSMMRLLMPAAQQMFQGSSSSQAATDVFEPQDLRGAQAVGCQEWPGPPVREPYAGNPTEFLQQLPEVDAHRWEQVLLRDSAREHTLHQKPVSSVYGRVLGGKTNAEASVLADSDCN